MWTTGDRDLLWGSLAVLRFAAACRSVAHGAVFAAMQRPVLDIQSSNLVCPQPEPGSKREELTVSVRTIVYA